MQRLFKEWDDAHAGHRERLRQRVEYSGFDGMQEHEVLEFLLCYAIPRQDVNALAHRLIAEFGSLEAVLKAEPAKLKTVSGMGEKAALWLEKIDSMVSAYRALDRGDLPRLDNVNAAFDHALTMYRGIRPPSVWQLCLSRDRELLLQRELCPSRAWGEKETLKTALSDMLASNAHSAVILQFIGGEAAAVEAYDLTAVDRYEKTLRAARCTLSDVLLLGSGGSLSLRREGLIPLADSATDYTGFLAEQSDPATLRLTEQQKRTEEEPL